MAAPITDSPFVGKVVRVVKGRKVPKGTVLAIFWHGWTWNKFAEQNEAKLGGITLSADGVSERIFVHADYVVPVNTSEAEQAAVDALLEASREAYQAEKAERDATPPADLSDILSASLAKVQAERAPERSPELQASLDEEPF